MANSKKRNNHSDPSKRPARTPNCQAEQAAFDAAAEELVEAAAAKADADARYTAAQAAYSVASTNLTVCLILHGG